MDQEERLRRTHGIILAVLVFLLGFNILLAITSYLADKIIFAMIDAFLAGAVFVVIISLSMAFRRRNKNKEDVEFFVNSIMLKEFGEYLLSEERERKLPYGRDKREVTADDFEGWHETTKKEQQ